MKVRYNTAMNRLWEQGLCASFFVLFFAFFAAQNQVETALGSATGSYSLGVLYGCFALSTLVAPAALRTLRGFKRCGGRRPLQPEVTGLVIGSAMYGPYLFACSGGPLASWRTVRPLCRLDTQPI